MANLKASLIRLICLPALCVSAQFLYLVPYCGAQTSPELEDLQGDERGPGFKEVSNNVHWLDVSNFYGKSYYEIEALLVGSGYRLAKRDEVARLASKVGQYSNEFGIPSSPSPKPGSKVATGFYDDSTTGSDESKAGDGYAFFYPLDLPPNNVGFTFGDDAWDKSLAIYDSGAWVVQQTATSCSTNPHSVDFDCDGITDKVVWRKSTGTWYVKFSTTGELFTQQWGLPGDTPIVGDYDGDGIPDLAVWRPSNGVWYIKLSKNVYSSTNAIVLQFGLPGDRPLRNDFDGDGRLDVAVWRPSNGNFYYVRSIDAQIMVEQWGLPGDVPLSGPRAD